jgi:carbonic anhydrase
MQKLIHGVNKFQNEVFGQHKALFGRLSHGQWPKTLFLTCSDSRIDPGLLTQSEPGDLFIIRNAGNIVPAWSGDGTAESAALEFAVVGLGIQDIIVCGHSMCGAMKGLLNLQGLDAMPTVRSWLRHSEAARRIVMENYPDLKGEAQLNVMVQENVLMQLKSLGTHPAVAARLAAGKVRLYGWVYKIETGEVFAYDPDLDQFTPLTVAGKPTTVAKSLEMAP